MRFLVFLLAMLLSFSADAAVTRHDRTVTVDGVVRSYTAYVPGGVLAKRVLFGLHGGGGNSENFSATSSFHTRTNSYVVVYPQAVDGVWNTGAEENGGTADDVGFMEAILIDLYANFNIKAGKHYCSGFSNGAAMCYRLASERSDKVIAVAGVGGILDFVPFNVGPAVNILHQHGLEDPIYPYNGGEASTGKIREDVEVNMERWATRDECGAPSITNVHPGEVAYMRPCGDGTVEHTLAPISGLGHAWPGDDYGRIKKLKVGPPRPDLDGTGAILDFLSGVVH